MSTFTAKKLRYYFNYVNYCEMCASSVSAHRILGKRLNTSQGKNPKKRIGITTTIAKCNICGLIYSNPRPEPFDLQDHYGVPPEEYWNESYFKVSDDYFKYEIGKFKSLVDFKEGMKALDIGAGLGKGMIALNKAGFDVYGFEPSVPFYERAISKMGIDPAKLKLGKMEEMEYAESSFDFISFGAVLEHLFSPSDAILRALKWLKPGGIIHIEVPSSRWLINNLINIYYKLTGSDYVGNLSPMHEPFHMYEFDVKSFRHHSARNGYEIAFSEYYVCESYMPKFTDVILKPYMKWTNKGMQLCVWLRKK